MIFEVLLLQNVINYCLTPYLAILIYIDALTHDLLGFIIFEMFRFWSKSPDHLTMMNIDLIIYIFDFFASYSK